MADLDGVYVAVVGPGSGATTDDVTTATPVGAALARAGAVGVTGGMGGVMWAAADGARRGGGVSIGLLPGLERSAGSAEHTVLVPTGLGELRNGLVVRAADVVVAVGGSWGTLSEIALAVRTGVPVVVVGGWDLPAPHPGLVGFGWARGSRPTSPAETHEPGEYPRRTHGGDRIHGGDGGARRRRQRPPSP